MRFEMIYLIVAIILIFVSNAAALLIIASVNVSRYVDIMLVCRVLDETTKQCTAKALYAGWTGCLAAAILLTILILINRRFPPRVKTFQLGSEAFVAFAPLVLIVVGYELWIELKSPWPISRFDTLHWMVPGGSAALSLGNLVWPLGLQFANTASTIRWRILFLSLLAPIMAQSPFRGVFLAVAIFGVTAPAIEGAVAQIRLRGLGSARRRFMARFC